MTISAPRESVNGTQLPAHVCRAPPGIVFLPSPEKQLVLRQFLLGGSEQLLKSEVARLLRGAPSKLLMRPLNARDGPRKISASHEGGSLLE